MKKLLLLIPILLLVGCSSLRNPTLTEAAILDTVSTKIAINNGFIESNPVGFPVATALKVTILHYTNNLEESPKKQFIEKLGSSAWTGASVNNILLVLGFSNGFSLMSGFVTGILLYLNFKDTSE
jgi:hypothetical protein